MVDTGGLFTYSIIVVDNDDSRSAEQVVTTVAKSAPIEVQYLVEPRQNISRARNMAVRNGHGEFLAFIDDDEFPTKQWLRSLFTECEKRNVDGVLGPVKPYYESNPPKWVLVGRFYDRPSYATGLVIDGSKGRTGNVLFRISILDADDEPFRPELRTGEDQEFFHRKIAEGYVFTWCHEAMAYEWVPPSRWNRSFMLRRALLRGAVAALRPTVGIHDVFKSLVAALAYIVLLPFALLLSHSKFMKMSVSLCDHIGKLLALVGINPIADPYVTE